MLCTFSFIRFEPKPLSPLLSLRRTSFHFSGLGERSLSASRCQMSHVRFRTYVPVVRPPTSSLTPILHLLESLLSCREGCAMVLINRIFIHPFHGLRLSLLFAFSFSCYLLSIAVFSLP